MPLAVKLHGRPFMASTRWPGIWPAAFPHGRQYGTPLPAALRYLRFGIVSADAYPFRTPFTAHTPVSYLPFPSVLVYWRYPPRHVRISLVSLRVSLPFLARLWVLVRYRAPIGDVAVRGTAPSQSPSSIRGLLGFQWSRPRLVPWLSPHLGCVWNSMSQSALTDVPGFPALHPSIRAAYLV
jgi:hypothetical protein